MLSIVLTAGLFYYLIRNAGGGEIVVKELSNAKVEFLFASIAASLLLWVVLIPMTWKIGIEILGYTISFKESSFINMAILPLKNIFPFKSVGIFRGAYLYKVHSIPVLTFIKITLLLTFISGCVISVFFILGIFYCGYWNAFLVNAPKIMLVTLLGVMLAVYLLNKFTRKNHLSITNIKSIIKRIKSQKKVFIGLVVISFLAELTEVLVFFLTAHSLNLHVEFGQLLLIYPLMTVISMLPLTFSGSGVREGYLMYFFAGTASLETLLAWGGVFSLTCYFLPAMMGIGLLIPFFRVIDKKNEI